MQTFDKIKNEYLDHDHPEYLTDQDFYILKDDIDKHSSNLKELDSVHKRLINSIKSLQLSVGKGSPQKILLPSDLDGGTFEDPYIGVIFDGGNFDENKT